MNKTAMDAQVSGAGPVPIEVPPGLPAPLTALLHRCLSRDPGSRPMAAELAKGWVGEGGCW
jgi:hypothetical protein